MLAAGYCLDVTVTFVNKKIGIYLLIFKILAKIRMSHVIAESIEMESIKRNMEDIFLTLNKQYPAILVTGPRQVGKTTMLQKLIRLKDCNRNYVSLDDLNDRALAKTDPAMFFRFINHLF